MKPIKALVFSYKKYEALRDKAGVTDYRVAKEAGITPSTFSDWRSGRCRPKVEKIIRIADFFHVPINYFLVAVKKEEKNG